MPKKKNKTAPQPEEFKDVLYVTMEGDGDDSYPVVFYAMNDVPDGVQVGIYNLESTGTVRKTTTVELV
jgi:hypothetical protein